MQKPEPTRVVMWVDPTIRERLRMIAAREQRTMKVVLERAICNEMERTGTPDAGKHSEAA